MESPSTPEQIFAPESLSLFPLESIADLEKLFEIECIQKSEPNVALWSIILGAIEHSLVDLDYSAEHSNSSSSAALASASSAKLTNGSPSATIGGESSEIVKNGPTPRKSRKSVAVGAIKKKSRGRTKPAQNSVDVTFQDSKDVKVKNNNYNGQSNSLNTGKMSKELEDGDTEEEIHGLHKDFEKENAKKNFPALQLDDVENLYLKFKGMLMPFVDCKEYQKEDVEGTSSELVKRVSDVVWSYLTRSYKADMPHIQSLYTYLMSQKLDCFGVALAVTAGCQVLGLSDVHLALSEDHAWVGFGQKEGQRFKQTAEVTWHGKGIEDKRGNPVGLGDDQDSWLYLKGHAVYCTRHMEVAAIVGALNYHINSGMNSWELMEIQQRLLWKLYDAGHLKRYPMALLSLAELEEVHPTPNRIQCEVLLRGAVLSNRTFYNNMHIYPYTTYGGYFYRQQDFKSALKYWGDAARIVQKYKRSKNDEEIYREFFEISKDYLPNIMKSCSTGFSANMIVRDPSCFANLLRLFDGICGWEERSKSNIVHITWATCWVNAIGKFDYTIRRLVKLSIGSIDTDDDENTSQWQLINGGPQDLMGDIEKASNLDDKNALPSVTLHSKKLQQLKDFFRLEKYNPSAMTLLFTAQSAVTSSEDDVTSGTGTGGRSRRERLSQNAESTKNGTNNVLDRAPPTKRARSDASSVSSDN